MSTNPAHSHSHSHSHSRPLPSPGIDLELNRPTLTAYIRKVRSLVASAKFQRGSDSKCLDAVQRKSVDDDSIVDMLDVIKRGHPPSLRRSRPAQQVPA